MISIIFFTLVAFFVIVSLISAVNRRNRNKKLNRPADSYDEYPGVTSSRTTSDLRSFESTPGESEKNILPANSGNPKSRPQDEDEI